MQELRIRVNETCSLAWVLSCSDVEATTGCTHIYFMEGGAALALARATCPDIELDAREIARQTNMARGDYKLMRFCFTKRASFDLGAVISEINVFFGMRPEFSGAQACLSETEISYSGESHTHVALVSLQMTELQQLMLYTFNMKVSVGSFHPVITFANECRFGGTRYKRFKDSRPDLMEQLDGYTRLNDDGVACFTAEINDDVPPEGLSPYEQSLLTSSANKSSRKPHRSLRQLLGTPDHSPQSQSSTRSSQPRVSGQARLPPGARPGIGSTGGPPPRNSSASPAINFVSSTSEVAKLKDELDRLRSANSAAQEAKDREILELRAAMTRNAQSSSGAGPSSTQASAKPAAAWVCHCRHADDGCECGCTGSICSCGQKPK